MRTKVLLALSTLWSYLEYLTRTGPIVVAVASKIVKPRVNYSHKIFGAIALFRKASLYQTFQPTPVTAANTATNRIDAWMNIQWSHWCHRMRTVRFPWCRSFLEEHVIIWVSRQSIALLSPKIPIPSFKRPDKNSNLKCLLTSPTEVTPVAPKSRWASCGSLQWNESSRMEL